jgi:hypothetical protein
MGLPMLAFLPYMKFGQSACMFCISHGIQCRQDRRYIAEIIFFALKIEMEYILNFHSR